MNLNILFHITSLNDFFCMTGYYDKKLRMHLRMFFVVAPNTFGFKKMFLSTGVGVIQAVCTLPEPTKL